MKRLSVLVTVCCMFCVTTNLKAQVEYQPFRVDLNLGVAIPMEGSGAGLVLLLEPKYALPVLPQLSVGFKGELDLVFKAITSNSGNKTEAALQGISSYLATADYHLTQRSFRPFVGAGLGVYKISSADFKVDNDPNNPNLKIGVPKASNFGVMLRGGFDVGHFRMAVSYNFAGKDGADISAGFIGFTLGSFFGGGKKKVKNPD